MLLHVFSDLDDFRWMCPKIIRGHNMSVEI
jgi:hypothetical protein